MSSGLQGVIRDALGWIAGALMLALVAANFDEIRAFNGQLLGIDPPTTAAGAATPRDAETLATSRAEPVERKSKRNNGSVELRASGNGHFEADAEINGRNVPLLVDTGASMVVLTYEDADRAGVYVSDSDFTAKSRTANGIARNAIVTLHEVCVESVCVRNVKAMVAEPGRLHVSLLGMTFLGRLARIDMQPGRLVLEE